MENLTRYNLQLNGRTGNVNLVASNDGFLVKFSDLAEALADETQICGIIENESPCAYCTQSGKGNCQRCCIQTHQYFFKGRKLRHV